MFMSRPMRPSRRSLDLYVSLPRASIRFGLQATPVDSNANAALREQLAGCLSTPPSKVALARGSTSQHKQLKVTHTADADWVALLALLVHAGA